jgi:hypothetical protein
MGEHLKLLKELEGIIGASLEIEKIEINNKQKRARFTVKGDVTSLPLRVRVRSKSLQTFDHSFMIFEFDDLKYVTGKSRLPVEVREITVLGGGSRNFVQEVHYVDNPFVPYNGAFSLESSGKAGTVSYKG